MGKNLADSKHPQFQMDFSIIFERDPTAFVENGEANEEVTSGQNILFYQTPKTPIHSNAALI